MKRRRVDSGLERQFLIGMITSRPFLASVAPLLDLSLIQTDYVRLLMSWCLDHYRTYGDAPGRAIELAFHAWVEKESQDESQVESVEALLSSLSAESDTSEVNVPYLLDQFGSYLRERQLNRLQQSLGGHLMRGDVSGAQREVEQFSAVALGQGQGFDPLSDDAAWSRAFAGPAETLVEFPGEAGRFLNRALVRDALIGIQGCEKVGKTFWCLEIAIRALRQRRRVAVFEVGDLSEAQLMLRLGVRLSGCPLYADQCGDIAVPRRLVWEEDGEGGKTIGIRFRVKSCPEPVTEEVSLRAAERFLRACGSVKGRSRLRFSVHSNASINVEGISAILDRWAGQEGFVPDVIIVDYADILAPEVMRKEFRHQQNDTWRALRRLSQERHALVVAPTQASAASYKVRTMTMHHFSEDKRKMAHVTGMLGINQTAEEKEQGLVRLNWIVLRESSFAVQRCLYVAQCLPLGRAFCCAIC